MPSGQRFRLMARAYLGLDRGQEALGAMRSGEPFFVTPAERFEALVLTAASQTAVGNVAGAREGLRRAEDISGRSIGRNLVDEALCIEAECALAEGDLSGAESVLAKVVGVESGTRMRTAYLRSCAAGRRGSYLEERSILNEVLEAGGYEDGGDVGALAAVVSRRAALVRESGDIVGFELMKRASGAMTWTDDLRPLQFHVARAEAFMQALSGNFISALRLIDRAEQCAGNEPREILARLDHIWISRICGDTYAAQAGWLTVDEMIGKEKWNGVPEAAEVLLLGAIGAVHCDPFRARRFLTMFEGLEGNEAGQSVYGGRRLEALVEFANARVERYANNGDVAIRRAKRAFVVADGNGSTWLAARAAALIFRMTKDASWQAAARERARSQPSSYLYYFLIGAKTRVTSAPATFAANGRSSRHEPPAVMKDLTAQQKCVFGLACRGLSGEAIAAQLGIRKETVRAHQRRIYRHFGVTNHAELMSRASALGATPG